MVLSEIINMVKRKDMTQLETKPLISIITVVYNGEQHLEETILSIINQTYKNVEYIIIDGGSKDSTIDIIKKYEDKIDHCISEPDKGIYDAMNKGIDLASGKWVNFMNAGDIFCSHQTLSDIFEETDYAEDILYGNLLIDYVDFHRMQKAKSLKNLWKGMQFCHQSSFVDTKYHQLNKFNISNKIAADLEFFYKSYKNGKKFKYIDTTISTVSIGGLSESNRIKTILASRDAVCKTDCTYRIQIYYYVSCMDSAIRSIIKKVLPKKIAQFLIKMKK